MNMAKLDFDNFRPEILKNLIARLARFRDMLGFRKSGHKYVNEKAKQGKIMTVFANLKCLA